MAIVHLDTGAGDPALIEGASPTAVAAMLRRRSADTLEAAYGFLKRQPDGWALLRAEVLCGARPASALTDALAAVQRSDGSFPVLTLVSGGGLGFPSMTLESLDDDAAAIVGSFEALTIAADARVLHADWVEPTVRFLESRQQPDGTYRVADVSGAPDGCGISDASAEPETSVEPGVLAEPGASAESGASAGPSLEADVFWTGMVAGLLGRLPVARPEGLEAAGVWLAERFSPEAVEHDGFSALCAYAHFFTNVAHDLSDEALQWCGRALEKGFRSRRLEAVATLRVLLLCDAQAMPGASFDVGELLGRVLEEQAGDGGYAELSPGGPATRTTQTFDAMLAIVRLCGALGDPAEVELSRSDPRRDSTISD